MSSIIDIVLHLLVLGQIHLLHPGASSVGSFCLNHKAILHLTSLTSHKYLSNFSYSIQFNIALLCPSSSSCHSFKVQLQIHDTLFRQVQIHNTLLRQVQIHDTLLTQVQTQTHSGRYKFMTTSSGRFKPKHTQAGTNP